MKIKAKLTTDQIVELENTLTQLSEFKPTEQIARLTKSIMEDVADKVHVRYRKLVKSQNLFNNKKVDLELKYHEAVAVTIFIEIMLPSITISSKRHNDLFMLHNYLHQKIA